MYHELFADASFWAFLFTIDQDLAKTARDKQCPSCGCRLHCADYPRKPRGARHLPDVYRQRLSFCCARDGCRKRVTPPSVRFLGRKVYLGAVVILVSAMRQGPSPRRIGELTKLFDVSRETIYRWREYWNEHFPKTTFWKMARARLVPVFEIREFPRSLWEAFVRSADDRVGWSKLLQFLAPISIANGLLFKVCEDWGKPAEDADRQT
jgi:hypothetical protein